MTAERYDAVLPERVTVACDGCVSAGHPTGHTMHTRPARAGDTVEVPCRECEGSGFDPDSIDGHVCSSCFRGGIRDQPFGGSGKVRVLLDAEPTKRLGDDGRFGWRYTGTVVPDA